MLYTCVYIYIYTYKYVQINHHSCKSHLSFFINVSTPHGDISACHRHRNLSIANDATFCSLVSYEISDFASWSPDLLCLESLAWLIHSVDRSQYALKRHISVTCHLRGTFCVALRTVLIHISVRLALD